MATKKELALIDEITKLAIKVTIGKSGVAISAGYIGHINVFEVRVLHKVSMEVLSDIDDQWAHLSGGGGPWTERESLVALTRHRDLVKQYLPSVDADGVPL